MAVDSSHTGSLARLADAGRMRNLLSELYRYLYADYEECQKEGINDMVEEGLVLEMDIIEYNHKMEMKKREEEVTKEVTKEVTEDITSMMVKNAYEKLKDIHEVAEILKLPEDKVSYIIKG
ncbi:MAG: hypothetical protein PHC41_12080 [Lachnospiraceae bacterium]|nr:hypothetical protein [Lachnospiraceae bacterium]MDD3616947.1 hypothetical protein [Lachnospiraceae bacterium]